MTIPVSPLVPGNGQMGKELIFHRILAESLHDLSVDDSYLFSLTSLLSIQPRSMGAPAALVAAAVLVTLAETREETAPRKSDGNWARILKRLMRFLLLTSFALEVVSIFVGNMTGNMCLGHGPQVIAKKIAGYKSPLALLYHHHE
jgi:hypothetical protein